MANEKQDQSQGDDDIASGQGDQSGDTGEVSDEKAAAMLENDKSPAADDDD